MQTTFRASTHETPRQEHTQGGTDETGKRQDTKFLGTVGTEEREEGEILESK